MSSVPNETEQVAPDAGAMPPNPVPLRDRVRRFEVQQIRLAIEEAGGDRRAAAARLGIGLSSLYRKLGEAAALADLDLPPRRPAGSGVPIRPSADG